MKVLFVTNIPSPYRVDFFNELGKYCNLTVLFEKQASDERDDSWKDYHFDTFTGIFMKGISVSVDMSYCPEVISYVNGSIWDYIICSDFLSPTGMKVTRYLKRHHIPYVLESDGGFVGIDNILKKTIKTKAIKGASWYFSTGKSHDDYYIAYGADKDRIIRYPFSSIKEKDILDEPLLKSEKAKIKKELGISEQFMVLAVGQFIHRKGFDTLLKAAKDLPKNAGVYFVGGDPTEEFLNLKNQYCLTNVHFIGFKRPSELKKYYHAADIFTLPTRGDIWGLVINEAFANGLPVITTTQCLAGVEMIKNGKNGYLIPVDDESQLIERICQLMYNENLCLQIANNNIFKSHDFTIESMVQTHIERFQKWKDYNIK